MNPIILYLLGHITYEEYCQILREELNNGH